MATILQRGKLLARFDQIVVVLHQPENPVNIGAVVRAMKNMGFGYLRLVQPAPFTADDLLRLAHYAEDVVERVEVFATLDAVLTDVHFVVGTAAVNHSDYRSTDDLRSLAGELWERAETGKIALLFGPEADGLDRAALDRCHLLARIPTNPDYAALNLAQAALIVLYELRMAANLPRIAAPSQPNATQGHLERLFLVSEEALHAIDFFKYNPAAVMHTLRQIVYRAELRTDEAALLLAIARQVLRTADGRNRSQNDVG
jgi:TrmH family RNA methyltransferase